MMTEMAADVTSKCFRNEYLSDADGLAGPLVRFERFTWLLLFFFFANRVLPAPNPYSSR
jgi:hypothetical protein